MTQIELDNRIENIVKKTVKYYYTDWKNYDRPKYMTYKATKQNDIFLIVRTCGTYIFSNHDLNRSYEARTILRYYKEEAAANIYSINLTKGTCKLIHKGIA